jgi:hypothetical protein
MADDSPSSEPTPLDRLKSGLARVRAEITRNRLRVFFALLLVASVGVIAYGATSTGLSTASAEAAPEAEPTDNVTVITESGRAGTIIAYNPDGSIKYYNNSRTKYFDVDPVEGEENVVEYTATDTIHISNDRCGSPPCARNYVERVDLDTGEVEVIFERVNHQETAGEWHDHVRVNETHIIIADILYDQVYMVNTETGIVEWLWDAQSDFPVDDSGGEFPRDWTHLNDVELLEDGRIMASLRNHDRVVFIEPSEGVQKDWTLGEENNYDILYEQHNPDYIPEERGGPAVVVADSENNRIKEFQREDGEWEQSWVWSDEEMQWPRDADRLPNGNTLAVDTHGNRVIEINPDGEVVWEVPSTLPYDAERLGTGQGSSGGQSARALGLTSQQSDSLAGAASSNPYIVIANFLEELLPHRWVNGIYFAAPIWFGGAQFGAAFVLLVTGLVWIVLESRWQLRDRGIRFRLPVYRQQKEE